MTQHIAVEASTGKVRYAVGRRDKDGHMSVPDLRPFPKDGTVFYAWQGALGFSDKPTPTSELCWIDSAPRWVETGELGAMKEAAIDATYADVDAVYQQAIGMRATEYARAEEAARAYLAADPKPAVASGYITGHAERNPTGQIQTNEWAAQQIVERADAFRWAELQMRNLRFARQVDMRAAVTQQELAAAVATWNEFITWLRVTLGL